MAVDFNNAEWTISPDGTYEVSILRYNDLTVQLYARIVSSQQIILLATDDGIGGWDGRGKITYSFLSDSKLAYSNNTFFSLDTDGNDYRLHQFGIFSPSGNTLIPDYHSGQFISDDKSKVLYGSRQLKCYYF